MPNRRRYTHVSGDQLQLARIDNRFLHVSRDTGGCLRCTNITGTVIGYPTRDFTRFWWIGHMCGLCYNIFKFTLNHERCLLSYNNRKYDQCFTHIRDYVGALRIANHMPAHEWQEVQLIVNGTVGETIDCVPPANAVLDIITISGSIRELVQENLRSRQTIDDINDAVLPAYHEWEWDVAVNAQEQQAAILELNNTNN